jgi:hypothetical protein
MCALFGGEIQRVDSGLGMSSCRRQAHNKVQEGVMLPIQTILHPTDFLMGSVAEQIVRKAPCPVLTVKMPQRRESCLEAQETTTASKEAVATK